MKTNTQTRTKPEIYYKFQQAFYDSVDEFSTPVVWNTQRQMGKSTILAKIAAKYLTQGDVWMVGPNRLCEEEFLKKVMLHLPTELKARATKSRIEVATPTKVNFLGSPTKFLKPHEGIDLEYNKPVLVIVDELNLTTLVRLDGMLNYLKDGKGMDIKFVAATTGYGKTDYEWIKYNFGEPEFISTAFETVNIWMEEMTGGRDGFNV